MEFGLGPMEAVVGFLGEVVVCLDSYRGRGGWSEWFFVHVIVEDFPGVGFWFMCFMPL